MAMSSNDLKEIKEEEDKARAPAYRCLACGEQCENWNDLLCYTCCAQ